jgi:hypothetical protein
VAERILLLNLNLFLQKYSQKEKTGPAVSSRDSRLSALRADRRLANNLRRARFVYLDVFKCQHLAAWPCTFIGRYFLGEFRQCTIICEKNRAAARFDNGLNWFALAQNDDLGFPDGKRHRRELATIDQITSSVLHKTHKLIGKLALPIAAIGTMALRHWIELLFDAVVQLRATVPRMDRAEIILNWSEQTRPKAVIQAAEAEFVQWIKVVSRGVRFVRFICDAGIVVDSKLVHGVSTNLCHINNIVTLPPFENLEWDALCDERSFQQVFAIYSGDGKDRPQNMRHHLR